ncbi:MAG: hypothetical protein K9J74_04435 [Sulfuritalea sp.]|nr:hypothetical protein [Sulfuritalea sp.]
MNLHAKNHDRLFLSGCGLYHDDHIQVTAVETYPNYPTNHPELKIDSPFAGIHSIQPEFATDRFTAKSRSRSPQIKNESH